MSHMNSYTRKLVLVVTGLGLVFILGHSLLYRVQHPTFTQSRQVGQSQPQSSDAMNRIQELMGRIKENPQDVQALTHLARLFMAREEYGSAASFWERVIRLKPREPDPRQSLGVCYFRMGEYEQAASQLRRVLELDSGRVYARYNLAVIYAEYLDRQEEGAELFRRVLNMEGADAELKDNARQALSRLSSDHEAE